MALPLDILVPTVSTTGVRFLMQGLFGEGQAFGHLVAEGLCLASKLEISYIIYGLEFWATFIMPPAFMPTGI